MGSQHSKGLFPPTLTPYTSLTLEELRLIYYKFKHNSSSSSTNDDDNDNAIDVGSDTNNNGKFYITQKALQILFPTSSPQSLITLYKTFDPNSTRRVLTIDVFGGLALSCEGRVEDKIGFIFGLVDGDHSDDNANTNDVDNEGNGGDGKCVNRSELIGLVHSVMRGLSRIKGNVVCDVDSVRVFVDCLLDSKDKDSARNKEITLKTLQSYLSTNPPSIQYTSNLPSTPSNQNLTNIYTLQTSLLQELTLIDTVLDSLVRHDSEAGVDERRYFGERGGDIRRVVFEGLVEEGKGVYERLNLGVILRRDDDNDTGVDGVDGVGGVGGSEEEETRLTNARIQATRRAIRKRYLKDVQTSGSGSSVRAKDAKAFALDYKRVDTSTSTSGGGGGGRNKSKSKGTEVEDARDETEDHKHALKITQFWSTLGSNSNSNANLNMNMNAHMNPKKLTLDELIDLIEPTGQTLTDHDAHSALTTIPRNAVNEYSLSDVISWYKGRNDHIRDGIRVSGWRRRLALLHGFVVKPWKVLGSVIERFGVVIGINLREEANAKANANDNDDTGLNNNNNSGSGMTSNSGVSTPSNTNTNNNNNWDTDSDVNDENEVTKEADSKIAVRVAVGHLAAEGKGGVKVDVQLTPADVTNAGAASASAGEGVNMNGEVGPDTKGYSKINKIAGSRTPNNSNSKKKNTKDKPKAKAKANQIKLFAATLLQNISKSPPADFKARLSPNTNINEMKSCIWLDLPINSTAKVELIDRMVARIDMCLSCIPLDYAVPVFVGFTISVVALEGKIKTSDKCIRITLYNTRDVLTELSTATNTNLASLIEHLSVHVELNITLSDLLDLTAQFVGYEHRFYGPQEEEEEIVIDKTPEDKDRDQDKSELDALDSVAYIGTIKARRTAILNAIKRVTSTSTTNSNNMSIIEIKSHLTSRGYSTNGTIAQIRQRLVDIFTVQAGIIGYGELSAFGEDVCNMIFKRVDRDNDGALNFLEVNVLNRALNSTALEYPTKYIDALREAGLSVNEKGEINAEGLTAYYERYGGLKEDAEMLAVGSMDDFVSANISITGCVRSKVVEVLDRMLLDSSHMHMSSWKYKVASFFGRYGKDVYLDWQCNRLSDLFIKSHLPTFLRQPGGPAVFVRYAQKVLSDGRECGWVNEMRSGVGRVLGEGYGVSFAREDEDENEDWIDNERILEIEVLKRISEVGRDLGVNVDILNITSLSGWKGYQPQPPWLTDILHVIEEEQGEAEKKKKEDHVKFDETLNVPQGTTSRVEDLKNEVERLLMENTQTFVSRRRRSEITNSLQKARIEIKTHSDNIERAVNLSSHHFLKLYDTIRSTSCVTCIHSINYGNAEVTCRLEMYGNEFFHLLPAGYGEDCQAFIDEREKIERGERRKDKARAFIASEKVRKANKAEDRARLKAEKIEARMKGKAAEEIELYNFGHAARMRAYGSGKEVDRKGCVEAFFRLYEVYMRRYYDVTDAGTDAGTGTGGEGGRDLKAVAVAGNNCGVVLFEFYCDSNSGTSSGTSDNNDNNDNDSDDDSDGEGKKGMNEEATTKSLTHLRTANTIINTALMNTRHSAFTSLLKEIKDLRKERKEHLDGKVREKKKQALIVSGGGGVGMYERVCGEVELAVRGVEEGRGLEAELVEDFCSDSDDDGDDGFDGVGDGGGVVVFGDDGGEVVVEGDDMNVNGNVAYDEDADAEKGKDNDDKSNNATTLSNLNSEESLTPLMTLNTTDSSTLDNFNSIDSNINTITSNNTNNNINISNKDKILNNPALNEKSPLPKPSLRSRVKIESDAALVAVLVKVNLVFILNSLASSKGDKVVDEEEEGDDSDSHDEDENATAVSKRINEEISKLKYEAYTLYNTYVNIKATPFDTTIRTVKIARIHSMSFPPEDWEDWGYIASAKEIEEARLLVVKGKEDKLNRERLAEALRLENEDKEGRRVERRERKEKRESKIREGEALGVGVGGLDLATLQTLNPKRASQIQSRMNRQSSLIDRKKTILQHRRETLTNFNERNSAIEHSAQKKLDKVKAIDAEVSEVLLDDKSSRSGLRGILSGARWSVKLDPVELRKEIVERECEIKAKVKLEKKVLKGKEQERVKEVEKARVKRERKEERRRRGEDSSSSSDSDDSGEEDEE